MKNVLFLTYFFPPLGGAGIPRTLKFTKYLQEFGWRPIIISADESVHYDKDFSLVKEIPDKIEIHRIGHKEIKYPEWEYLLKRLRIEYNFPDIFWSWYHPAYLEAREILKKTKIDLIFSSSAPFTSHFVAMKLKEEFNIPWVADFRDPWSGNNYFKFDNLLIPLQKLMLKNIKKAEEQIIKTCNRAIVVSWHHKEQICKLYSMDGKHIEIITNGYDESDFQNIKTHSLYPDNLTITFTGSFYDGYKEIILTFLRAIQDLDNTIEIVFIGKGASEIQGTGQNNVTCIYNIPKNKMLAFASATNFLFLLGIPFADWQIPGKLYEYLRIGKPILAIVPPKGDAAKIINEANAGFVLSYDIKMMKEQLIDIFKKYKIGAFKNFLPDMKYISQFDRRELTQKLGCTFDDVIK